LAADEPGALVAAALPPRAGVEMALELAAAQRTGLVEAPLHAPGLLRVELPPGAANVRVAHGYVTLAGRGAVERLLAERDPAWVSVEVRGLPEEAGGDAGEVLVHALALVRKLFPDVRVGTARLPAEGSLDASLEAAGVSVGLRVRAHGQ